MRKPDAIIGREIRPRVWRREPTAEVVRDTPLFCVRQSNEQEPRVRARGEPPFVREIQIMRHEKTALGLRGLPHVVVGTAAEPLLVDRMDVTAEADEPYSRRRGKVLVELRSHATFTSGGTGEARASPRSRTRRRTR